MPSTTITGILILTTTYSHICYVVFLIIIIFILISQLLILTNKHHKLRRKECELKNGHSPIYAPIIKKQNEQINELRISVNKLTEKLGYLERKNRSLSFAILSKGLAAEKVSLVQSSNDAKEKASVKYRLTNEERTDLVKRIRICYCDMSAPSDISNDSEYTNQLSSNNIPISDTLTDDELILHHLQNCGVSNADIAILMGISAGTLRQRKYRLSGKLPQFNTHLTDSKTQQL